MRKLLSLLLIIPILALTSCSTSSEKKDGEESKSVLSSEKKDGKDSKHILKIYAMEYDRQLQSAVTLFNTSSKDVTIEVTKFNNIDEYMNKINTETLSGEGPDIFAGLSFFKSLRKAISTGVFCDLNELIEKDKDFKLSEYNASILDCGVIDGKRYILPMDYFCDGFYTTKELLGKNNMSFNDSSWTWKEFAQIAKDFTQKNKGKGKYLVGYNFGFNSILRSCGISFIDYDNKKCSYNSPEFIELLQNYKDIYPAIFTNDMLQQKKVSSPHELLDKGTVLLINDFVHPYVAYTNNSIIKSALNNEMQMLSLPTYKSGSAVTARLSSFAAINSKCKYKQQAFNFIKYTLTKEYRVEGQNYGIPIKSSNLKEELNKYLNGDLKGELTTGTYKCFPININQEIFDKTVTIAERTKSMEIIDSSVSEIIGDELRDFLSGKKTADQTAKAINDKVMIFLNE
jgi:ABC-type glycerol-3-phosphate transport system substrate-binding protein